MDPKTEHSSVQDNQEMASSSYKRGYSNDQKRNIDEFSLKNINHHDRTYFVLVHNHLRDIKKSSSSSDIKNETGVDLDSPSFHDLARFIRQNPLIKYSNGMYRFRSSHKIDTIDDLEDLLALKYKKRLYSLNLNIEKKRYPIVESLAQELIDSNKARVMYTGKAKKDKILFINPYPADVIKPSKQSQLLWENKKIEEGKNIRKDLQRVGLNYNPDFKIDITSKKKAQKRQNVHSRRKFKITNTHLKDIDVENGMDLEGKR
eukprot:GHVP01039319.1.p1 GENE.GHVP01039319.1~~GHVP01039319.1.p1  ORF type:complete len:260 (-),score=48.12 GHVP01039319.1:38-817(-)